MSIDYKAIPLLETNNPFIPTPVEKKQKKRSNNILRICSAVLVIIIIILIITLVIILTKKCNENIPKEKELIKENKRVNNPYWNSFDLPNFAKPQNYIITLELLNEAYNIKQHNNSYAFCGIVVINFMMTENSNFLVLNSKSITTRYIILKQVSTNQNTKIPYLKQTIVDDINEQTIYVFNDFLRKSLNYSIEIPYFGEMTLSKSGIIRTFYRSFILNKTYEILYSKLEPIGARRMFPCFDEPDKKAVFVLKLIHYSKFTALSNMPLIKSVEIDQNALIYTYSTIPKNASIKLSTFNSTFIYMSTYLVAFVLLEDYEQLQQSRKTNFNVSIWIPKGFKTSKTTLEYACLVENTLELFFNFSSPFPKTDHIYIPNFLSGAMENWGLITYRESQLLMPPGQSEQQYKKAYMTIAHELAHIWFGNWVTMKTWKDLWLNEGFATYFASKMYYSTFGTSSHSIRESFVYQSRQILEKDGKSKSFPVRLKVVKFKDIFNSYTYNKGEALLLWLNYIMSDSKFQKGIQSYIKKYSQNNPTTKDFYREMQKQGSKDTVFNMSFDEYFDPWLNKIGYPILTINYDTSNKQLLLSQQSAVSNSSENESWPIYTLIKTNSFNVDKPILLKGKNYKMNLTLGEQDFVILNSDGTSYIRVNYSSYLWGKIINNLRENNKNISSINKIILFDDYFFFAYSGLINISITKDLMDTLVNETNSVLWKLFYNRIFTKMSDLFKDDRIFLKWTKYVKQLSKNAFEKAININVGEKLNVETETFQKQLFLLNCEIDNQEMLDYFSRKFQVWINSPKNQTLPKHLVTLILYYGIRENDKEEYWMKMWRMMIENNESSLINKDQIAIGLAGTSRSYRLNKLLNYILTPGTHNSDIYKLTFVSNLVSWIMSSNNGVSVLSQWILRKSKEIKKYAFGDNVLDKAALGHFDSLIGKIASSAYDVNTVRALSTLHSNKEALVKIALSNNKWRENIGKRFFRYL